VWRADLDAAPEGLLALLSEAEHARAARILGEPRRLRWGRARAILRALLGVYLGVEPRTASLRHSPEGKPGVSTRNDGNELFFNVSHSGPLGLFAFTRAGEVGIDVELPRRRTRTDLPALAGRVFGAAEGRRLRGLPEELREGEFLRGWVRHEALLKQAGGPRRRSWLAELDPGGEATAAVALDRAPTELRCWEWSHGGARPHDC